MSLMSLHRALSRCCLVLCDHVFNAQTLAASRHLGLQLRNHQKSPGMQTVGLFPRTEPRCDFSAVAFWGSTYVTGPGRNHRHRVLRSFGSLTRLGDAVHRGLAVIPPLGFDHARCPRSNRTARRKIRSWTPGVAFSVMWCHDRHPGVDRMWG